MPEYLNSYNVTKSKINPKLFQELQILPSNLSLYKQQHTYKILGVVGFRLMVQHAPIQWCADNIVTIFYVDLMLTNNGRMNRSRYKKFYSLKQQCKKSKSCEHKYSKE